MIVAGEIHVTLAGALIALFIAGTVGSTLWWMLHPPVSHVQRIAARAEHELERMVDSLIVAFSPEIDSSHMVALAVKLARGERSELLALYVIEVPYTLPPDAEMPAEERVALDALGAAESYLVLEDMRERGVRLPRQITAAHVAVPLA